MRQALGRGALGGSGGSGWGGRWEGGSGWGPKAFSFQCMTKKKKIKPISLPLIPIDYPALIQFMTWSHVRTHSVKYET